ncbi:MAG TPA: DUF4199 domain-containing protein [Blastocatellia bacterium]
MKTEIKWGVIFTIVGLLWMVLERVSGLHDKYIHLHPFLTNLFALPAIIMMVLAIKEKKRLLGGKISFTQAFLCGLAVSVVVAALSPLAQWITARVISPNYFPNAINYAVQAGLQTREQAEAFFNLNSYMLQASLGALVMGILTTLIIAAFVRTKNS